MKDLIQELLNRYDSLLLQNKVPPTAYYKNILEYRNEIKEKQEELKLKITK